MIQTGGRNLNSTKEHMTSSQLRSFGLIVGAIFLVIGLWPMVIRGQELRWWGLLVGGVFIIPALTMPVALRPIHRAWMIVGEALGWLNTRIILAIGFYGVVMPVGLTMRLVGKDPMQRRYSHEMNSYRVARVSRPGEHMQRQF
jgi:hypothetical protein